MIDRRRFGIIEVRFVRRNIYHLTIGGQLWSEVEWSPARQTWCIQDACGHCLAHCDHVHGEHIDQRTAIDLAKAMIRDGSMPTPEEAEQQLKAAAARGSAPEMEVPQLAATALTRRP
jgi:hypothetical protein